MFDLIAFDADDTLWENNALYARATQRFKTLLAGYGVVEGLEERLQEIEAGNLPYFGYGAMSFVLSLIETAVELTQGRITAADIAGLVTLAKEMISAEVQLFAAAGAVVAELARRYRLILITKGELSHQQSKIIRSGLGGYFNEVHIVVDKTPQVYASILEKHAVAPGRFLMVGDSLRSDIRPVLELGGWGVFVPSAEVWVHELSDLPAGHAGRFYELADLSTLPALLDQLEQSSTRAG